ncbi:MAG: DUF1385 domain-containing protein [Ruminococcus sp.]|nr:DUF1385 domain-containing protein [Ruminococcus sp.]
MGKTIKREDSKHRSKIGGQALIEGVMMKGAYTGAMACRLPDGTIDVETWPEKNGKDMPWYRKCPLVRGSFNFVLSMKDGYRCLMKSAEKQVVEGEEEDETEEMGKFEQWLNDKLGDKIFGIIMSIAMVIGIAFAVFAFVFLPKWIIGFLISHTPINDDSRFIRSLLEGIIKIAIFLVYMIITGCMKDIRRTYEYHGAEHKTIACFEAGDPLTVENVKKHTRFHPRCGTSFIFITLIVSILVMCLVPLTIVWQRAIVSILLLPLVVGISYEFIRIAGKSNNIITRILSWPGLQIQRITTREPDASQIECAIEALKPCIPENLEDDEW